jgi:hypothetical protein
MRKLGFLLWFLGTGWAMLSWLHLRHGAHLSNYLHEIELVKHEPSFTKEQILLFADKVLNRTADHIGQDRDNVFYASVVVALGGALLGIAAFSAKTLYPRARGAVTVFGFGLLISSAAAVVSRLHNAKTAVIRFTTATTDWWHHTGQLESPTFSFDHYKKLGWQAVNAGGEMLATASAHCQLFATLAVTGGFLLGIASLFPARTPFPPPPL